MDIKTHKLIDRSLSGEPLKLEEKYAEVLLSTDERMRADETGLVHGGFLFSSADYCAMLAVNHPNVVLAGANVRFLKPVRAGESVLFKGKVVKEEGKKRSVLVEGFREGEKVFEGEFLAVVPREHVLKR
ncbi:MAG: PaaI family thioesterase [Aquificae bacterium]|nr:PaaI family thioesterase [Aquificota bacterium]